MTDQIGHVLADTERAALEALLAPEVAGLDGLRLTHIPFVPEVRLHLAEDPVILWARMEAEAGEAREQPFWAAAWAGGQALARYILDHPDVVAGRRVLDLGSGSGLVAIAAAKAGAAEVVANDLDPYALAAIMLNARANRVDLVARRGDLLTGDFADVADVVLAGDVFYSAPMAARILPFLEGLARRGARVLVGDPGRECLPRDLLETVATYEVSMLGAPEDSAFTRTHVFRPRPTGSARCVVTRHRGRGTPMTAAAEHSSHAAHEDHIHSETCGHASVQHGDHVDYLHDGHAHYAHGDHYDECALDQHVAAEEHTHVHGEGCGHEQRQHGDHVDYLHGDHRHAAHEGHYDEH
jgi:predicted nicotinamide N-methyase